MAEPPAAKRQRTDDDDKPEWTSLKAADVGEAFALVAPGSDNVCSNIGFQLTLRDDGGRVVNTLVPDWNKLRAVVGPRRVRKPSLVAGKKRIYYALRHEPTGHVVLFGEVYGAFRIWSNLDFDKTTNRMFRFGDPTDDDGVPASEFIDPLRALLCKFL